MVMLLARNGLNGLVYHPILKYRIVLLNNINNVDIHIYVYLYIERKLVVVICFFLKKKGTS